MASRIPNLEFDGEEIKRRDVRTMMKEVGVSFSNEDEFTVTIGDSVHTIERDAFKMCFGLSKVQFGNSVQKIGRQAFMSCNSKEIF